MRSVGGVGGLGLEGLYGVGREGGGRGGGWLVGPKARSRRFGEGGMEGAVSLVGLVDGL